MKKLITYISAILMICSNALAVSQLVCITDDNITIAIITKNKNGKWCWGEDPDDNFMCDETDSSTSIKIEDEMTLYEEVYYKRIDVDRYTGHFLLIDKRKTTGKTYHWTGMCSPREKKY